MKSKVAIIECNNYEYDSVLNSIERGIHLLGGINTFISQGEKILLKPNLLAGDKPEKAVTVHPSVFKAICEVFQKGKVKLFYGDSPGKGKPERAAKKAGIKDIADELGIPLADFQKVIKVSYPEAIIAKQLSLVKGIFDVNGIISISKMKTHGLTRITGAIKNQFGYVPGLLKSEYHVKMSDIYDFSTVLIDINKYLLPRLFIMDGIVAMEGNGPRSGEPKEMNVLLFSTDPVALDAIFCKLINLIPEFVPTMKIASDSNLGTYNYEKIELVGDNIEKLIQKDFKVIRRKPDRFISSKYFPSFLKNIISPKPVINYNKCTNCGSCILQCPVIPKAVNWVKKKDNSKPIYNYKKCIRCYCCQEICPDKAIFIKTPLLRKIINR